MYLVASRCNSASLLGYYEESCSPSGSLKTEAEAAPRGRGDSACIPNEPIKAVSVHMPLPAHSRLPQQLCCIIKEPRHTQQAKPHERAPRSERSCHSECNWWKRCRGHGVLALQRHEVKGENGDAESAARLEVRHDLVPSMLGCATPRCRAQTGSALLDSFMH